MRVLAWNNAHEASTAALLYCRRRKDQKKYAKEDPP